MRMSRFHPFSLPGAVFLIAATLVIASPAATAVKGAILQVLHPNVLLGGEPAIQGSAVLPGTPVAVGQEGSAALFIPGGEYLLGAESSAVLESGLTLGLESGLVEVSGPLAVRVGGWRIRPSERASLMVGAAPTAIYISVREGSAALLGPTGGKVVIPAGKAAELDTQTAQPSIAGDHHVRNIVIGSAITGGIAAAFTAYYETHKSVQCTAAGSDCSCDHCVASPAQ